MNLIKTIFAYLYYSMIRGFIALVAILLLIYWGIPFLFKAVVFFGLPITLGKYGFPTGNLYWCFLAFGYWMLPVALIFNSMPYEWAQKRAKTGLPASLIFIVGWTALGFADMLFLESIFFGQDRTKHIILTSFFDTPGKLSRATEALMNIQAGMWAISAILFWIYYTFLKGYFDTDNSTPRQYSHNIPKPYNATRDFEKADKKKLVFLGREAKTGKPLNLPWKAFTEHAQYCGPSGTGKTRFGLFPVLIQALKDDIPVVFFDGKGSLDLMELTLAAIPPEHRNRVKFFNPLIPNSSHSLNPLLSTKDPAKLTDIVMIGLGLNREGDAGFYSDTQSRFILHALNLLTSTGRPFNFEDLSELILHPESRKIAADLSRDPDAVEDFEASLKPLSKELHELTGLVNRLDKILLKDREIFPLLNSYAPQLSLPQALTQGPLTFLSFNAGTKPETSRALARMALMVLANAIGERQGQRDKPFALVILDEFGQFPYTEFGSLISTAREANVGLILSHQTNAQLEQADRGLSNIVQNNTALKMIYRQEADAQFWGNLFGTKETTEITYQTEEAMFSGHIRTGRGTEKPGRAFKISPDELRELPKTFAAFKYGGFGSIIHQPLIPVEKTATLPQISKTQGEGLNLRARRRAHAQAIAQREQSIQQNGGPKGAAGTGRAPIPVEPFEKEQ